jgi:tRNA pseudouridine32 synthase / 23S rRNA pseudouridine746 synthase
MADLFTAFNQDEVISEIPQKFTYPFDYVPDKLSLLAVEKLQKHLKEQEVWEHNFGLVEGQKGKVIGKMFGVLVVQNADNEIGYLAAFSGKLANGNHHVGFVPPVYDALEEGSFLNLGMQELSKMGKEIDALSPDNDFLKEKRRMLSNKLQSQLFDQYHFLNISGESKSLKAIFLDELGQKPPSAAGECAVPKLLQYAFQNKMKPIALAEFWWGASPKSTQWKHGEFYPVCTSKCKPILKHMLEGMEVESLD